MPIRFPGNVAVFVNGSAYRRPLSEAVRGNNSVLVVLSHFFLFFFGRFQSLICQRY